MRLFAAAVVLALGACASSETMRGLQAPEPAPRGLIIFPESHRFRDSVYIEYISGVSEHSYVFAEPNANIMRQLLYRALENSGARAATMTRARYGLRVEVSEAQGPGPGTDFTSRLRTTYILVERNSGREVWRHEATSEGFANYVSWNENDLRTATQRSWRATRAAAVAGLLPAGLDLAFDVEGSINDFEDRSNDETGPWRGYDEWTEADWDAFWQIYSQTLLASALYGPVTVVGENVNPWNFLPWADDEAAAIAASSSGTWRNERVGSVRAARANYRAASHNVTSFLMAFTEFSDVELTPVLPCYGDAEVEALKLALMARGHGFRTDSCRLRR